MGPVKHLIRHLCRSRRNCRRRRRHWLPGRTAGGSRSRGQRSRPLWWPPLWQWFSSTGTAGRSTTTGASHTPAPASNGGITSEDQLLHAIRTQGWTPLRAEQLFALDVGPLPGVSVQGITPTGGFDASMAVTGLYGQWDHLTAAQRTTATKYITGRTRKRRGASDRLAAPMQCSSVARTLRHTTTRRSRMTPTMTRRSIQAPRRSS